MINLTTLLCGSKFYGDSLRYSFSSESATSGTTRTTGPVVVWNCTRSCNQNCEHCYMEATPEGSSEELETAEAKAFIDDLDALKCPVLLLSGGEPLLRHDFWEITEYAIKKGLRVTISTNGSLITPHIARDLKKIGVSYVGISLDGMEKTHDAFRNSPGAFNNTLEAIRHCRNVEQKVGLRFTLTPRNTGDLEEMMYLLQEENIPRICFYHLVTAGRGKELRQELIPAEETREIMDYLLDKTREFFHKGEEKEILTVDNHADGVYLYLKLQREDPSRAEKVWELLRLNGGNRSGIAIAAVDPEGKVHPDQFSQEQILGNIRESPFSQIWMSKHPLLEKLRHRTPYLKGKCHECRWLPVCNGNLRARAYAATGDFWEEDPGCYIE